MLTKKKVKVEPVSPGQSQIYWSYDEYWAIRWGGLQVTAGILTFIVGIPSIVNEIWKYAFGMGVWCGALFICSGSVGIVSSRTKSKIQIVLCLVLALLSVACSAAMLIVSVVALQRDNMKYKHYKASFKEEGALESAVGMESRVVVDALLLVCSLLEIAPGIGQAVKAGDAFGCSQDLPDQEEWVKATAMRYIRKIKDEKTPHLVLIPVFMPTPDQRVKSQGSEHKPEQTQGKVACIPPEAVQFGLPLYLGPPQYVQAAQLAFSDSDAESSNLSSFDKHMAPETPPPILPEDSYNYDEDMNVHVVQTQKANSLDGDYRSTSIEAEKFAQLSEQRRSQTLDNRAYPSEGERSPVLENASPTSRKPGSVQVLPTTCTDELKNRQKRKGRGSGFDNGAFKFNELEEKLRMPKT